MLLNLDKEVHVKHYKTKKTKKELIEYIKSLKKNKFNLDIEVKTLYGFNASICINVANEENYEEFLKFFR